MSIDCEFLTNDGREFHKFAPAIFMLNFLISSRPYIIYINHLHFEDYDHVHQHFAENSFFSVYNRNVATQTFMHDYPNYIIIDITNIQNFVCKI